jgi:hypothetical protein
MYVCTHNSRCPSHYNCYTSFKWFLTTHTHWWFVIRNKTIQYVYSHIHLLCYKQLTVLHVSATCCGDLQVAVLWRMCYRECQNSLHMWILKFWVKGLKSVLKYKILIKIIKILHCNVHIQLFTSFKEQLLEDGHNRWPKHEAGYAVYNTVSLHISIYH